MRQRPDQPSSSDKEGQLLRGEAKSYFAMAAGVGVIGAIGLAVGGAMCPVCVVATPALLGAGFYKRWRAARRAPAAEAITPTQTQAPGEPVIERNAR